MTHLQTLLAEAAALPDVDQDDLAALLTSFLASRSEAATFSPEELAHIRRIEAEPFAQADPAEVAAFFAKRA